MADRIACHGCKRRTPIRLLDGKPSARAMAAFGSLGNCADHGVAFDRLLCEACYGPGWLPATTPSHTPDTRLPADQARCLVAMARLCTDSSLGEDSYWHFAPIVRDTGLPRATVRAAVRRLKRRGLAEYSAGLWTEDGEPAGAGYRLTKAGRDLAESYLPKRIQLRRTKGWRLPPNTVNVARPTKWGNRFHIGLPANPTAEDCVRRFREEQAPEYEVGRQLQELRGKDLACWCKPGAPCHADVLLAMANAPLVCEAL